MHFSSCHPLAMVLLWVAFLGACSTPVSTSHSFKEDSAEGLVIVGFDSEVANDGRAFEMTFGGYDPETRVGGEESFELELADTVWVRNFNYLLPKDKTSYFLFDAKPGVFALEQVEHRVAVPGYSNLATYKTCRLDNSFFFEVKPGTVTYIGNFRIFPTGPSGWLDVEHTGFDAEAAKEALKAYPNITAPIEIAELAESSFIESCP